MPKMAMEAMSWNLARVDDFMEFLLSFREIRNKITCCVWVVNENVRDGRIKVRAIKKIPSADWRRG